MILAMGLIMAVAGWVIYQVLLPEMGSGERPALFAHRDATTQSAIRAAEPVAESADDDETDTTAPAQLRVPEQHRRSSRESQAA